MEAFIGKYVSKLDEKHRTSFPPNFKRLFDEKELIVRKDSGRDCLILSTVKKYEQLPKDIQEHIEAYIVKIDNKGRISIPKQFRKTVGIKEILFNGVGDYIELWQKEEEKVN